jgi:invasion protein IalB
MLMMPRRGYTPLGLAAALLAPLLLLGSPAQAQDKNKPTKEKAYQDWTLVCQKPEGVDQEVCVLVQQLVRKDGEKEGQQQQRIMLVEIGYTPKGNQGLVIFTLPLGIRLPPGLSFQVDSAEAQKFPVEICLRDGCRAALPLTDALTTGMKGGTQAKLTFVDPQSNPVALPVSLKGFTAGFKALADARK